MNHQELKQFEIELQKSTARIAKANQSHTAVLKKVNFTYTKEMRSAAANKSWEKKWAGGATKLKK